MSPERSRLERHLGYWLRLVSNQVSGRFARALHAQGLSVAEWVALNQIGEGQLSSAKLAADMGMTRGAISKILDKLAVKDWVTRTASDQDGRVQFLALTRLGRRLVPELTAIADANDAHFFEALSANEQATLRRILRKVAAAHPATAPAVD